MPQDAIKKVADAELTAKTQKTDAAGQARLILAEATRDGKALLDKARQEARKKAGEIMDVAESQAEEHAKSVKAEAELECDKARRLAESRLDLAADAILERIVNL